MVRAKADTAVGEWARRARLAAGITSADKAAQMAGVPAQWLRSVEAHHIARPGADRLAALERLYKDKAPEEAQAPRPAPGVQAALDRIEAGIVALQDEMRQVLRALGPVDPRRLSLEAFEDEPASNASPRRSPDPTGPVER